MKSSNNGRQNRVPAHKEYLLSLIAQRMMKIRQLDFQIADAEREIDYLDAEIRELEIRLDSDGLPF